MSKDSCNKLLCWTLGLMLSSAAAAQPEQYEAAFSGDFGIGLNQNHVAEAARAQHASVVLYLNGEYGPAFARIDTFGVGLWPLAAGHLELLTRVVGDGYQPADRSLPKRRDSLPLGLGSLQITQYGAFMANLYRDAGASHGTLASLLYAAELPLKEATFYPQFGLEYRNAAYLRYYDGTSAYRPGAANSPYIALFTEIHLKQRWYFNVNLRKSWLGTSIRNSPLVIHRSPSTALAAISYRFN